MDQGKSPFKSDSSSYVPFVSRLDEMQSLPLPPSYLSMAADILSEMMTLKKMITDICHEMLAQNYQPNTTACIVTVKAPSISDFEIIKPISKGAYGRVFLAEKIKTKDIFAIKVLKREEMITNQQRQNILLEVCILALCDFCFPFFYFHSFSEMRCASVRSQSVWISP